MVGRFGKNKQPNYLGGHKKYRPVSFFSGDKIKTKPDSKLPKHFWKALFYLLVLSLLIYFFFASSIFKIRDVIVEGNNNIASEMLANYVPIGKNIFVYDTRKAIRSITDEHKEIKSIQIYKGLPNAIKIVVLESDGKLIWQTGTDKYLVDASGEVIRKLAADETSALPLVVDKHNIAVTTGTKIASPSFVAFINNIYDQIFGAVNVKPVNFEVTETTFDVNLITDAGFYVKFDATRSSSKELDNLKSVLVAKRADVHEYIDLRIDGWAYYK